MQTRTEVEIPAEGLQDLCINTLRTLAMDAVERASSGHPGAPMGAAPMAFALWTKFLKHDPADSQWIDRDRFILSAGHASMLLYSLLHLTGYDLSLDELKAFRQLDSATPGHPEYHAVPGADTTTGPLGQGFSNAVGMAMAERFLAERFNRPEFEVIDHYTYVICSDGDLMEGMSSEAASLAGHLRLGKIVCLYDSNGISIDGSTELAFTEDVAARFRAYGWHVDQVDDGNDVAGIERAIAAARRDERPSLVTVRTHIGYGAPSKQDTAAAHGAPLGAEEVAGAKEALGWPYEEEFYIPDEVRDFYRASAARGGEARRRWKTLLEAYGRGFASEAAEFARVLKGTLPDGWDADLPAFTPRDGKIPTRKASGKALNALAARIPELVGGSADLQESNNTAIEDGDIFRPGRAGRYIHFGVREHAMGAAVNGMVLHGGVRPFGATFLIFSDYMRPTIRLAALMEIPSIFIFTHDSIGLGEDGPTHQPVEQLPSLRAIPNLIVLRPADANETVGAWKVALTREHGPAVLCLSRQGLPVLERPDDHPPPVERGAYVVRDSDGDPDIVLLATGSEVHVAVAAAEMLHGRGLGARVVSMPSWELFERQSEDYRDEVIPRSARLRVAVEAASPFGWHRWVGPDGVIIGLDRFGSSGSGDAVMEKFGFTPDAVAARVLGAFDERTSSSNRPAEENSR
jgi:transketolase